MRPLVPLVLCSLLLAGCATTREEGPATSSPVVSGVTASTPLVSTTPTSTTPASTTPASTTPASPTATTPASPAAPMEASVSIVNFAFNPAEVRVAAGGTVTWTNAAGTTPHTATADDGSFDSTTLGAGSAFSQVFRTPGTYPYRCELHSSMRGTVVVV